MANHQHPLGPPLIPIPSASLLQQHKVERHRKSFSFYRAPSRKSFLFYFHFGPPGIFPGWPLRPLLARLLRAILAPLLLPAFTFFFFFCRAILCFLFSIFFDLYLSLLSCLSFLFSSHSRRFFFFQASTRFIFFGLTQGANRLARHLFSSNKKK